MSQRGRAARISSGNVPRCASTASHSLQYCAKLRCAVFDVQPWPHSWHSKRPRPHSSATGSASSRGAGPPAGAAAQRRHVATGLRAGTLRQKTPWRAQLNMRRAGAASKARSCAARADAVSGASASPAVDADASSGASPGLSTADSMFASHDRHCLWPTLRRSTPTDRR